MSTRSKEISYEITFPEEIKGGGKRGRGAEVLLLCNYCKSNSLAISLTRPNRCQRLSSLSAVVVDEILILLFR